MPRKKVRILNIEKPIKFRLHKPKFVAPGVYTIETDTTTASYYDLLTHWTIQLRIYTEQIANETN